MSEESLVGLNYKLIFLIGFSGPFVHFWRPRSWWFFLIEHEISQKYLTQIWLFGTTVRHACRKKQPKIIPWTQPLKMRAKKITLNYLWPFFAVKDPEKREKTSENYQFTFKILLTKKKLLASVANFAVLSIFQAIFKKRFAPFSLFFGQFSINRSFWFLC